MSKAGRAALGIASLAPFFGVIALALYAAANLVLADLDPYGRPRGDPLGALSRAFSETEWVVMGAAVVGIAVLELILTVIFSVLIFQRHDISSTAKIVWIIAAMVIGFVALPMIWLVYLMRPPLAREKPLAGSATAL